MVLINQEISKEIAEEMNTQLQNEIQEKLKVVNSIMEKSSELKVSFYRFFLGERLVDL